MRSRLLLAAVFGLVAGLAGLLLGQLPFFRVAESKLYDIGIRWTVDPSQANPAISVVEIDEISLRRLEPVVGRWPWPRLVHAVVIDFLARAPAKAVAYDVFMAATKDWTPFQRYFRRCLVMAIIGVMFPRNIARYAAHLLQADGYSEEDALKAVKRFLWREPGIFGRGWKIFFAWFRPGFHPWDHDNRALVTRWRTEFDAELPEAVPA